MASIIRKLRRNLDADVRNAVRDLVDMAGEHEEQTFDTCRAGGHLQSTRIRGWSLVLSCAVHREKEHWHLSALAPRDAKKLTEAHLATFNQICDEIEKWTDAEGDLEDLTPADAPEHALHHFAWHSDGTPVSRAIPAVFAHFRAHAPK